MGLIRSINRAEKDITGNPAINSGHIHGWDVNMDENTNWVLIGSTSNGNWPVKFVRCKPHGGFPLDYGLWEYIDSFIIPPETSDISHSINRVDNENQFFFVEVQTPDLVWHGANGAEGYSDAAQTPDGNGCGMSWYNPGGGQGVSLTILPE